ERRPEELEQAGERDLGLRFDPAGAQDAHALRPPGGVLEQRRLSDPGLADEDEHAASAGARIREDPFERLPLPIPTEQHSPILPDATAPRHAQDQVGPRTRPLARGPSLGDNRPRRPRWQPSQNP